LFVDLTRLQSGGQVGGIKPALRATLHSLATLAGDDLRLDLLAPTALHAELRDWLRDGDRLHDAAVAPLDLPARLDCNLHYASFGYTDRACPGIPTLTLIVDLLHRDYPESLPAAEIGFRETALQQSLQRSDAFHVISDYTRERLAALYPASVSRLTRAYLPTRPPSPPASQGDRPPHFLYPANGWTHKNHETLLVGYALFRHRYPELAWPLVLCGHLGATADRLAQLAAALGITDAVHAPGYVSDAEMERLWQSAGALLFPSLHEGLGLPVLEAMQRGVPILASNATALPEIAGDAARYFDARRPEEIAAACAAVCGNAAERERLARAARRRADAWAANDEMARLGQSLRDLAAAPARWRHDGYHAVDGLLEPLGRFALPSRAELELRVQTRPLGVARTLEVCRGAEPVAVCPIPAHEPAEFTLRLPPGVAVLTLRVPDASRLSATDPRTHGTLLTALHVTAAGATVNLLGDAP
jgi:glycosyltransferase involved in cell wall biosynthesis